MEATSKGMIRLWNSGIVSGIRTTVQGLIQGLSVLVGVILVLGVTLAQAKPMVLTQEGIGAYDTVARGIVGGLGSADLIALADVSSEEALKAAVTARDPEILIAVGVAAARLVSGIQLSIPSVVCLVPESERSSLKGIDATGVALEVPLKAQAAAIQQVLPGAKRLGILYNPAYSKKLVGEAETIAKADGLRLVTQTVRGPSDISAALGAIAGKIDAVWMLSDRSVGTAAGFRVMLLTTLELNLPLVAYSGSFVRRGALFSLAPDFEKMAIETVHLVQEVLAGGGGAQKIPWRDSPTQLVINLNAADRLGITLPASVKKIARLIR